MTNPQAETIGSLHMRVSLLLCPLVLATSSLQAAEDKPPAKFDQQLKDAASVPQCAKLFQAEIHSVTAQILTVHDDDSLEKARREIVLSGVRIGEIAAKLKALPVPSAADRAKLTAEMEASDEAHRKLNQDKFKAHFEALPDSHRESLKAAASAFFAKVDGYKDIFSNYFGPVPEK